ncbi:MAG: amidase [Vulcanimicrobiaceae bacterium]
MGEFSEYERYDAIGLAQLVRDRHVTAAELLEAAIQRAEAANPRLNGLVARRYDRARGDAGSGLPDGPFQGVPFLVKDLGPELAGTPMTMGSRYFRNYVPVVDHLFIKSVKTAGLNIFGKTNTPEFGLVPYTEPALFGPCRNPWDTARTPGGSSGGSAALVAAGVVPMAHGNDMGGSIRIPASCVGLFGMKPSRARMPTADGAIGDANVDLCISRSVRDSALFLDCVMQERGVLYQAPPAKGRYIACTQRDPGRLRIAVVRGPMLGHGIDPEAREAVDAAAALCESLGHEVSFDEPQGIDYPAMSYALLLLFASQIGWYLGAGNPLAGTPLRSGDLEPATVAMLTIARVLSADELTTAVTNQRVLASVFDAFMQRYDVLLMPTLAAPPIRIGELALTQSERMQIAVLARLRSKALIRKAARDIAARMFDWLPYTPVFNLTGQPAMTLPLHTSADGLPVGVQFAARLGEEGQLFSLAVQIESAAPWAERRPPRGPATPG